jgi:thiamine kinase-like enzyme
MSQDVAAQALEMLAQLHAHWWRAPELELLGPPGGSLSSDGIVLRLLTEEAWEDAMLRPSAADLPPRFRRVEEVRKEMERLWEADRNSCGLCMVHGDAHPGNLFFEQDGRPGFLDWQRLMQCDWAHDVNYLLVSSMEAGECAATERTLVEHYLQVREAKGVPPMNREEAWGSYRQHTVYGLVWNVVPPVMQPIEVVTEVAARFNVAARRHLAPNVQWS